MASPNGAVAALPDTIKVVQDMTPNELRALKEETGRPLGELIGGDAEDMDKAPDRIQSLVWVALRRAGYDVSWQDAGDVRPDMTEAMLERAARDVGLEFTILPGEGGFYAPKLEFHLKDAIGRTWQCGTLQLDFVLPERLDASYVGEDGHRHRPVMLHRALLGSMERFVGVLIEHYAGHLPLWLAPLQAVVATITSDADGFAGQVQAALSAAGLRAETDLRNEKINYKVRDHSLAKVPVILVVGKKEAAEGTVAVRRLGGEKQEVLALTEAVNRLRAEAAVPGA